jgi:hypothetical protein
MAGIVEKNEESPVRPETIIQGTDSLRFETGSSELRMRV